MLRGTITPEGASVTNKNSSVKKIYAAINTTGAAIKAGGTDPDFICSGVPFHSYESSSRAQREISLISTVTLILIIVILFCVFRSLLPAIFSFLAIGISLLLAGSTTLLVFREIHVLSFVFGTTLIGTCVDYSIHYFIHWKGNPSLKTGSQIRSHIFRGIVMSFASTEICFAVLLLAPFGILRQFAVFSLAGMLSSFLTVICLFPYLKIPVNERQIHVPFCGRYCGKKDLSSGGESRNLRDFGSDPEREGIFRLPLKRICLAAIVVISLSLLFVNRDQARVENNISGLYTMSGKLLESERIAAGVLNHGSSGWYFLVSGSSPEETLEQEEALRRRLDTEVERGALGSYLASSLFVPSIQIQQQSYEAAKFLLPLADKQFSSLGFPPETADEFGADFAAAQGRYILPEEGLPPYLRELISNLWIGNPLDKGGTSSAAISSSAYYSCVLPLHAKDETPLRAIAGELDGVFFMNKLKDVGSELDALTRTMLFLFIAAYVLIAIVTRCFYSWRQTFRICAVPFLMALVMVTVLACLNIPLGFFSVTGIVLVFGLGLDYMFYITESRKAEDDSGIRTLTQDLGPGGIRTETSRSALTILAIGLSFVTTALSFGALGLSGFTPVHIFGLTVFTGLTTAFIVSMLLSGFDRRHNPL
jgi:predicted exporter